MSKISISKSVLESLASGNLSHNEMVKAAKAALDPTRTFVMIGNVRQEIPGLKGIIWYPYATLVAKGLTRTYGAVANGRWLPVSDTGTIIPGFSWKGLSVKPSLFRDPA